MPDTKKSSVLKFDEEDDGAKVPLKIQLGKEQGIAASEEADRLSRQTLEAKDKICLLCTTFRWVTISTKTTNFTVPSFHIYNTGIQVGQVSGEMHVPSGCFLKDQQLELRETFELFHKQDQLPQQVGYLHWNRNHIYLGEAARDHAFTCAQNSRFEVIFMKLLSNLLAL